MARAQQGHGIAVALGIRVEIFFLRQVFPEPARDFIRIAGGQRADLCAHMLKLAAVGRRAHAELFGAIARVGDAAGGHRVGAQKFRQVGVVQAVEVLHLL